MTTACTATKRDIQRLNEGVFPLPLLLLALFPLPKLPVPDVRCDIVVGVELEEGHAEDGLFQKPRIMELACSANPYVETIRCVDKAMGGTLASATRTLQGHTREGLRQLHHLVHEGALHMTILDGIRCRPPHAASIATVHQSGRMNLLSFHHQVCTRQHSLLSYLKGRACRRECE